MRRAIVAAGLFWLGVVFLAGSLLSWVQSVQADEGLADLGYAVLAVLAFILAGGLHGGFLLATPPRPARWKLAAATGVAGLTVAAAGLLLLQGVGPGTVRVAVFAAAVTVPAVAGLVRSARLWRG